jgi:hypothetical protein
MLWRALGVLGFLIGVSGNIVWRYIWGVLVVTQLLVFFYGRNQLHVVFSPGLA